MNVAVVWCGFVRVCRPGSLLSHNAAIMIPIALFCLNAFFIAGVECQSQDRHRSNTRRTVSDVCHLVTRVWTSCKVYSCQYYDQCDVYGRVVSRVLICSWVYLVFAHFMAIIADISPWQCCQEARTWSMMTEWWQETGPGSQNRLDTRLVIL